MKLLVIHQPDNPAPDDFCFGIDGELAMGFATNCTNSDCGCSRALTGLSSSKGSTTVRVTDGGLDHDDAALAVMGYLNNAGWSHLVPSALEMRNIADKFVAFIAGVAAEYDEGTVLRPRYDHAASEWTFTEATL